MRRFGAINLVIDLVSIGFTRELGPLLTALLVLLRSGTANVIDLGTSRALGEVEAKMNRPATIISYDSALAVIRAKESPVVCNSRVKNER